MADRHAEGIEKAADYLLRTRWMISSAEASSVASNTVTAYLDHAFPVVDSMEGLDALPVGTVVRSGAGTIACHYGNGLGVVFGDERPFSWDHIALPARVIHWGAS